MAQRGVLKDMPTTIEFERFWRWLQDHHNCILRAGTPEVVVFDHEEYHWHLWRPDAESYGIQVLRGKRLVAEINIFASDITYVESVPEEKAVVFDCVSEAHAERFVPYFFVMAHGMDEPAADDAVIN